MILDKIQNSIYDTYNTIPGPIRQGIGEMFWHLNHGVQYLLAGAKEESIQIQGMKISYIELGDRHNPTLVILHGFSDAKESFLSFSSLLKDNFHIIIPDMPGFGNSSKPDREYSLEFYSNVLNEFLKQIGVEKFHGLGNSMGGAILLEYNSLFKEKLLSIVLSCSAGLVPEYEGNHFYSEYKNGKNLFEIEEELEFEKFISRLFYKKSTIPLPVRHYLFNKYKKNGRWYAKLMSEILGKYIGKEEDHHREVQLKKISDIEFPVLILWGKFDGVIPEDVAYLFKDSIPHAKMIIMDNTGHLPHLENPKDMFSIVRDFYLQL